MADIPHIVFGLHDKVVQSQKMLNANPYVRRHIRSYHGGVLETQSHQLFAWYAPAALEYILTGGDFR